MVASTQCKANELRTGLPLNQLYRLTSEEYYSNAFTQ